MRKEYFDSLYQKMADNKRIWSIFVDLGYPRYEEFKKAYPDRVINTGASEQTALDLAVGLALEDQIPFLYTITPFYWRGAETIRTYISHEQLPVRMVGAGRDDDYSKHDGFSHDATDIGILMDGLRITSYYPNSTEQMRSDLNRIIDTNEPAFLSLRR